MKTSLTAEGTAGVLARLSTANQAFRRRFPGEPDTRQPLHTVYGGAHLFRAGSVTRIGAVALRSLEDYAPDPASLAQALGRSGDATTATVYERVREKLQREPVEDFRIDFEDGFGYRPDDEEDAAAETSAREVAAGLEAGTLPPFIGIRIKAFTEELRGRAIRSLDIFLSTLLAASGGRLPGGFVVTLPKITIPEQVASLAALFEQIEERNDLAAGSLKMELMIESAQSVMSRAGACTLPLLLEAAAGRCVAAHFGTYDYTASCSITAEHQVMDHPACDFARHLMKVSFADTGIWICDGATNVMPIGPHRAPKGAALSAEQQRENREVVHRAWRLAYEHIRHSLRHGFYQGWDLHPAQLPIRYAACYSFFIEGLASASARLKHFIEMAAQATLAGDIFDDAATGQGLLNYFLRAYNCGAIGEQEVRATGLSREEMGLRSFSRILAGRRART